MAAPSPCLTEGCDRAKQNLSGSLHRTFILRFAGRIAR
jgi:hypothetical protein